MGIICLDQPGSVSIGNNWATIPYFSISLSLNVLLTLVIVIRLILYARNVRTVMGGTESGGLYKASVTMFIESCVLYAVSSLLALVLIGVENDAAAILLFILPQTQVRAFPRPRSSERSPNTNVTMDWIGHWSIVCHSSSRKQERIDERKSYLRTSQFVQGEEPRGVGRWG